MELNSGAKVTASKSCFMAPQLIHWQFLKRGESLSCLHPKRRSIVSRPFRSGKLLRWNFPIKNVLFLREPPTERYQWLPPFFHDQTSHIKFVFTDQTFHTKKKPVNLSVNVSTSNIKICWFADFFRL